MGDTAITLASMAAAAARRDKRPDSLSAFAALRATEGLEAELVLKALQLGVDKATVASVVVRTDSFMINVIVLVFAFSRIRKTKARNSRRDDECD